MKNRRKTKSQQVGKPDVSYAVVTLFTMIEAANVVAAFEGNAQDAALALLKNYSISDAEIEAAIPELDCSRLLKLRRA